MNGQHTSSNYEQKSATDQTQFFFFFFFFEAYALCLKLRVSFMNNHLLLHKYKDMLLLWK